MHVPKALVLYRKAYSYRPIQRAFHFRGAGTSTSSRQRETCWARKRRLCLETKSQMYTTNRVLSNSHSILWSPLRTQVCDLSPCPPTLCPFPRQGAYLPPGGLLLTNKAENTPNLGVVNDRSFSNRKPPKSTLSLLVLKYRIYDQFPMITSLG